MTDWRAVLARLDPYERAWIEEYGGDWRALLTPPVLEPEPGDVEVVEVEITAPDGTRFDVADLRATHVGQKTGHLPLGDRFPRVAGTVTAAVVHSGRRTATLTIRIDDVPAWRAAGTTEEPR